MYQTTLHDSLFMRLFSGNSDPEKGAKLASQVTRKLRYLASYKTWQSDSMSPLRLAYAGLSYAGHDDVTKCDSCHVVLSQWQRGDDPVSKHRAHYPDCPAVNSDITDDDIITIVTSLESNPRFGIRRSSASKSKDSADSTAGTVAQSTSALMPPSNLSYIEACQQIFKRATERNRAPVSAAAAVLDNERCADPPVDRSKPDYNQLRSERIRLSTFYDWPASAARIVSGEELAKAGLFFTGQADKVQCAFCRGSLSSWGAGDRAADEHRRHFPQCPFVRGESVGTAVLDNVDNRPVVQQQHQVPVDSVFIIENVYLAVCLTVQSSLENIYAT